jgi:choline monooxygenase
MPIFEIDPDIKRARTLDSDFYNDESHFNASKDLIFARSWQLVARADEVESLKPVTILPGFLDEPVLLSRNNGEIACLSNVCTHRGKILVERECSANLIRCAYHGRRFSLDGKMLSMPEFEGVEDFPTAADDLTHLPLVDLSGFLFASIDPIAPLQQFFSGSAKLLEESAKNGFEHAGTRAYSVDAHWALYCENYLEGFHIPFVHHSLNDVVDYGTYQTKIFRYSSLQTGFDADGNPAGQYLFVFPNLMFNLYPWGVSVNIVRPMAPDRTEVVFLTYVSDESKLGTGAGSDLHRVEMEDEAVVESVQKGIKSRLYKRGRYSPTREQGTHHFHRLICEFIH